MFIIKHLMDRVEPEDAYNYFRGVYHVDLSHGLSRTIAEQLASFTTFHNVTLLHQSEDPSHSTATALYEFLSELQAYCSPGD